MARVLRIHADDGVAVALEPLAAGTAIDAGGLLPDLHDVN